MQKTYIEEVTDTVEKADVAVQVLLAGNGDDVEFVAVRPTPANAAWWAGLRANWHARGLHSIGFLAVVDGQHKAVFKEPVTLGVATRLAAAFQTYCETLATAEAKEQMPEYDWQNCRYVN